MKQLKVFDWPGKDEIRFHVVWIQVRFNGGRSLVVFLVGLLPFSSLHLSMIPRLLLLVLGYATASTSSQQQQYYYSGNANIAGSLVNGQVVHSDQAVHVIAPSVYVSSQNLAVVGGNASAGGAVIGSGGIQQPNNPYGFIPPLTSDQLVLFAQNPQIPRPPPSIQPNTPDWYQWYQQQFIAMFPASVSGSAAAFNAGVVNGAQSIAGANAGPCGGTLNSCMACAAATGQQLSGATLQQPPPVYNPPPAFY